MRSNRPFNLEDPVAALLASLPRSSGGFSTNDVDPRAVHQVSDERRCVDGLLNAGNGCLDGDEQAHRLVHELSLIHI